MNKRESFQEAQASIQHSSGEPMGTAGEVAWEYAYADGLRKGYELAMDAFSFGITKFGLDYNEAQQERAPF